MTATALARQARPSRLRAFASLCKLRVNSLIVFTAMVGMMLAQTGFPPLGRFLAASVGIGLVAAAAAAVNCLVERTVDARMARTRSRPLPRGDMAPAEALGVAMVLGGAGLFVVNFAIETVYAIVSAYVRPEAEFVRSR